MSKKYLPLHPLSKTKAMLFKNRIVQRKIINFFLRFFLQVLLICFTFVTDFPIFEGKVDL